MVLILLQDLVNYYVIKELIYNIDTRTYNLNWTIKRLDMKMLRKNTVDDKHFILLT